MQRRSYHTLLKDAVRMGKCPKHLQSDIHRSNIYRWIKEPGSKYIGRNPDELHKYVELFESIQRHPGLFFAYGRLVKTLSDIFFQSTEFFKTLRQHKDKVVKTIIQASQSMNFSKALKVFRISKNTFYNWKADCDASLTRTCKRLHHNQLTSLEIINMEKLVTNSDMAHWSISSLYHWARRKNLLHASLGTWYNTTGFFNGVITKSDIVKPAIHL